MKTNLHKNTPGHYEIQGARAIDGDTLEAVVSLPFQSRVIKRIRLAGWWAPEMRGSNRSAGILAQHALQKFLDNHVCFIFSRGERQDKYGRVIATLYSSGKVVEPGEVLGVFALTEEQHKREADELRKHDARELLGYHGPEKPHEPLTDASEPA
jgi:hypothetical protein